MKCFSDAEIIEIFKNPVKRQDLPKIFDCPDRAARKQIEQLQKKHNIVNLSDGRGYFLADDKTALRYAEQEKRRAKSDLNKANMIIARCLKSDGGEVVPVRAHFRRIKKATKEAPGQIQMEV